MARYKFTITTTFETDDLDLIQDKIDEMEFDDDFEVRELLGKSETLAEETTDSDGLARSYIKIEEVPE